MAELDAEMIVMSKQELEEMLYRVSYQAADKATSSLFNGLAKRFMYDLEENMRAILYEIEDMNRK